MPTVRIFADYGSPGWLLADEAARQHPLLPVSDDLLDKLADWSARFESCDPTHYEDIRGSCFDFMAFAAEGLELARAVKRALPQWRVLYWDEAMDWFLARDPRHRDRGKAEYEVPLEKRSPPQP